MNIFDRLKFNQIEGMSTNTLKEILLNKTYDSIVFTTILITTEKKVNCIKNYYCKDGIPAPKSLKKCGQIQKHFNMTEKIAPYNCVNCHLSAISLKENKIINIKI